MNRGPANIICPPNSSHRTPLSDIINNAGKSSNPPPMLLKRKARLISADSGRTLFTENFNIEDQSNDFNEGLFPSFCSKVLNFIILFTS